MIIFIYREKSSIQSAPLPTPLPTPIMPTPLLTPIIPTPTPTPIIPIIENILIVLGNEPLDDNTPTIDTMKRVDAAATFFNRQLNKDRTIIVFTGGPTAGKKTEAGVMADYAMKKYNVPQESIILEEKARSTQENAVLVAKIFEKKNIKLDKIKVFIVSKSDHLDWAIPLFKKSHAIYKDAKRLSSFIERSDSIIQMKEYLQTHDNQRVKWRMQNLIKGIQGID